MFKHGNDSAGELLLLDQVLLALVSICADHNARLRDYLCMIRIKEQCSCNIGDGLPRNFIDRISRADENRRIASNKDSVEQLPRELLIGDLWTGLLF